MGNERVLTQRLEGRAVSSLPRWRHRRKVRPYPPGLEKGGGRPFSLRVRCLRCQGIERDRLRREDDPDRSGRAHLPLGNGSVTSRLPGRRSPSSCSTATRPRSRSRSRRVIQRDPRRQVLRKGPRDPEKEGKGPQGDHEDEEGVESDGDA